MTRFKPLLITLTSMFFFYLALPPAELCFFDDAPVNCEGARAAGWQAIRFKTTPAAQEAFDMVLAQA